MKLDRSRPYAETLGPSVARYHQDGKDFDANGDELDRGEAEVVKRKPGRPPKSKTSKSLVAEHVIEEMCAMAAKTPSGAFVEFGVYQGGSAVKLAEVATKQGRELHLFDTFTGIPFVGKFDQQPLGDFSDTSAEAVKELIPSAVMHVGVFPETMPKKFPKVAFLHIDADQYQSYVDAIRIFRPLMVPGGVMWFDDVGCLPSADRAVTEAFPISAQQVAACNKVFVRF